MDPMVDPTYPRFGEEPHTVEHWLTECPGTAAARLNIFGSMSLPLCVSRRNRGTEEGVADVSAHPVGPSCQNRPPTTTTTTTAAAACEGRHTCTV